MDEERKASDSEEGATAKGVESTLIAANPDPNKPIPYGGLGSVRIVSQFPIIESREDSILFPVSSEGRLDGGLALTWSNFPQSKNQVREYEKACKSGKLKPGVCLDVGHEQHWNKLLLEKHKHAIVHIFLGATRAGGLNLGSKIEWVQSILSGYSQQMNFFLGSKYIAVPMLGVGQGGLNADDVFLAILNEFQHKRYHVSVYWNKPKESSLALRDTYVENGQLKAEKDVR